MRLFLTALAATFLYVGSVAAQAPGPPVASIAALRSHMGYWANRTVRVRGQIDLCSNFDCHICPEAMTQAGLDLDRCLSISFSGFETDPAGGRTAGLMEDTFRFAIVTLEAKFDPTCLGYFPARSRRAASRAAHQEVQAVVCTDRASVLRSARVIAVHSRKTADTGLGVRRAGFRVTPAPAQTEREVLAAYRAETPPGWDDGTMERRVFVINPEDIADISKGWDAAAEACVCREDSCDGRVAFTPLEKRGRSVRLPGHGGVGRTLARYPAVLDLHPPVAALSVSISFMALCR